MDETAFDQQQILTDQIPATDGKRVGASMSPVDLAGELVGGASTCEELGEQAFDFFKVYHQYARKLYSDIFSTRFSLAFIVVWFVF